jgi:hypothetical protein
MVAAIAEIFSPRIYRCRNDTFPASKSTFFRM